MKPETNSISRIDLLLIGGLLSVSFLGASTQLFDETLTSRYLGALIVTIIGFGLTTARTLYYLHHKVNRLDILLFAFCVWQVLSVTWAINTAQAFGASFRSVAMFLSYFLLRVVLTSDGKWKTLLPILVSFASSAYLVLVWVNLLQISMDFGLNANSVYMLRYPSETKNLISLILLVSIPFHLHTTIKYQDWKRWFGITNMLIMLGTLFVLSTRGISLAIIGIGASLLLSQIIWSKHRFRFGIPVAVVLVLLGTGHWFSSNLMKKTNTEAFRTETNKPIEEVDKSDSGQHYRSANERLALWGKTLGVIKKNPILGVGAGNWQIAYPLNGLDGLERAEYRVTSFKRPHNLILSITSELGIVGLILFSVLVLQFFLNVYHGGKEQIIVGCAMVGFLVAAMFDFPLERMEHNLLFATMLALMASIEKTVALSSKRAKFAFASLITLGLIGITVHGFRFIGESNYHEMRAMKSQNRYEECIEASHKVENPFYTVDWINYPFAWFRGVCYTYLTRFDDAEREFERAVELNPGNFHSHNNLGFSIAQQGRFEEAIPYFEESLKINSKFEDARFNLAYSLVMLEKPNEALDVLSINIRDTVKLKLYKSEAEKRLID